MLRIYWDLSAALRAVCDYVRFRELGNGLIRTDIHSFLSGIERESGEGSSPYIPGKLCICAPFLIQVSFMIEKKNIAVHGTDGIAPAL